MDGQSSDSGLAMRAEQSICIECGICCSETMFDSVPLDEEETHSLADLFAIERGGDRPRFSLACPHLSNCRCTVYERRPRICRKFRCKTLIEHEDGGIEREEAMRRIAAVRQAMDDLRPLLKPGESMREARARRNLLGKSQGRVAGDDAAFMLKAFALDVLVDRFLLRSDKARLMEVQTDKLGKDRTSA